MCYKSESFRSVCSTLKPKTGKRKHFWIRIAPLQSNSRKCLRNMRKHILKLHCDDNSSYLLCSLLKLYDYLTFWGQKRTAGSKTSCIVSFHDIPIVSKAASLDADLLFRSNPANRNPGRSSCALERCTHEISAPCDRESSLVSIYRWALRMNHICVYLPVRPCCAFIA